MGLVKEKRFPGKNTEMGGLAQQHRWVYFGISLRGF
jgi:hypothetical protein